MNYYFEAWRKYAVIDGRARRKEYWTFRLLNILIYFCFIAELLINQNNNPILAMLMLVFVFAMLIPTIAITIRRLHDTGRSGWWYFIDCVPLIGSLWLFVLTLLDSQPGTNKYGPNPKETAKPETAPVQPERNTNPTV